MDNRVAIEPVETSFGEKKGGFSLPISRVTNWQLLKVVMLLSICFSVWKNSGVSTALPLLIFLIASELYRGYYFNFLHRQSCKIIPQVMSLTGEPRKNAIEILSRQPGWWVPVLNIPWVPVISSIYYAIVLAKRTGVSLNGVIESLPSALEFFSGFLHPNWSLLPEAITVYARQTLDIAILGTVFGFVLSVPFSLFCSRNLMAHNFFARILYVACRALMVILRALPTFLLGLMFVALVGLGPFPGVLAITLFSFGVMVKLFSETIEAVDSGLLQAIHACGGGWISVVRFSVLPLVLPNILAQFLYCAEINIHSATVLGLIGAEGIGLPIHEYLSSLAYDSAAVYIYVVIMMTIIIDYLSAFFRNKII